MSTIVLQAGAARRIAEQNPAAAREVLGTIETSGRQALAEMRRLLNVMRADDNARAERAPQPGLAQLDAPVQSPGAAGLPVSVDVDGAAQPLSPGLDLTAYRVVQEALTNALKHAHATHAEVALRHRGHVLEVEVRDHSPAGPPSEWTFGHGLIGMRERVDLFGGHMVAGPDGDGFKVCAQLPIEGER